MMEINVTMGMKCSSYTTVCPPVREDTPRALARGLSPVQADKLWYYYHSIIISVDLAQHEIFRAKDCDF